MDADINLYGVTRFDMKIDGVAQTGVTFTPVSTVQGVNTYNQPMPVGMKPGNHKVDVSACTIGGCSNPLVLDFVFTVTPPTITNLRITP